MATLDDYADWEGTIDDLVVAAGDVLALLGQSHLPPPNVRLVRDYARREILSPVERRGREGYYGFQHLKELVAARILVNEGVPLAKIAEQFARDRDIAIVALGLPPPEVPAPDTAAAARWRELGERPSEDAQAARSGAGVSAAFMRRSLEGTSQRMDLHQRLRRLGAETTEPRPEAVTRLALTDWCWLLIDTERLRALTLQEADDIGHAIVAALSDPRIKKRERP